MSDGVETSPSPGPGRGPRIDAHHHLWDLDSGRYAWPTPAEPAIYRTFTAAELGSELATTGIDATVIVQATDSLADTDAMLSEADQHAWIAGVVGWLPLADRGLAERELDARQGRLCGVRHLIHWEDDPSWLVRPDIQPGLRLLAERRLPFDVVAVFPDHLALVPIVADTHRDLILVIDHLAKPPFRGDGWERWERELRAAAARPTVRAKLSGLETAVGPGWSAAELERAWDVALDAFGAERLMFGSDWPVCRSVSTYAEVVAAADVLAGDLSPTEQARVLGGTAADVYRLHAFPSATPQVRTASG